MDILTEDMKKELRKKFNELDTKEEKFQEQVQAIVEELIEVNKKKIGDIVVKKTVDEALEEEKEGFKEIKQLMSEGVLEDLQDNELRNSLEQQAKDGIVDEISEKVSLEKAGFLKEPQKPISVEDIIEEVLNQLEEIVEEKKKELDNEIAEKEEVIKKVEKREKLKVSKAKMNNLHQKTKTYKGTEGKNLNENVEKAIVDLDQQIKALVAETTVDNKELQSEDLEKEREELIEQKNKLDDMLKSIKEKYMKDKSKNSDKTKENNNFQEDDKKRKEDKSKDDKEDDTKEDNSKEEKKDKTKGSKKEEVKNNQSSEDKDNNGRDESKESQTPDSESEEDKKDEEKEDDNRRTKAIETKISMVVNKISPDIEPEELIEKSEKIREIYKTCIEKGYTKEEMDKALKYVPLKANMPTNKKDLYSEEPFTAADLVEIGKIGEIRRKYLEITDKPTITEEDKKIIEACQKKFDDLSERVFIICDGEELMPLQTSNEYIEQLRNLKNSAKRKTLKIESLFRKIMQRPSKSERALYEVQRLRGLLEKIISDKKRNTIYEKYNVVIKNLKNNPTIKDDVIPEELEIKQEEIETEQPKNKKDSKSSIRIKVPKDLIDRSDSTKKQDDKEGKKSEEDIELD